MGLIPLPAESEASKPNVLKATSRIQSGMAEKTSGRDKKIVFKALEKLEKYLGNDELTLTEVNDLITYLEKSVMLVQKHKREIVENANKKLKVSKKI